jgi:hypothetical protein
MNEWILSLKSWEIAPVEDIRAAYLARLYRREGWYPYVEREVNLTPTAIAREGIDNSFLAEFVNVTEQGELLLRLQNKEEKKYHFKQIRFVL